MRIFLAILPFVVLFDKLIDIVNSVRYEVIGLYIFFQSECPSTKMNSLHPLGYTFMGLNDFWISWILHHLC